MKILMFAESFGSSLNTFINNEIEYLSKRHEIKCVCKKYWDEFKIKDVDIIEFNRPNLLERLHLQLYKYDILLSFKQKKYAEKLNAIISSFQPDIIHCHFGYESLLLLDNFRGNKIPVIVHFHGYGASKCLKKKSYIRKMKHYMEMPNVFPVYVSDFMKQNLEHAGISMQKGMKLYYGINLDTFMPVHKKAFDEKPFIFLQVSTLVEKKGIAYTLEAFKQFLKDKNEDDYKLVLTGNNEPQLTSLKKKAQALGIAQNVQFFGRASRAEVLSLMCEANVFVHHSITDSNDDQEGIPNAIMEAMAMELPVISTIHAGIPELVVDGVNGFLVKEKDVVTYVERMNKILSWGFKKENRTVIEKKFNYLIHNCLLEKRYEELAMSLKSTA